MSDEYRPHVVKQGDYLTKLAFVHGVDAEEVWNHEKNQEIKASRENMDMLAPGDVVHLPVAPKAGLPFSPGTTNRYRGKVPAVDVNLIFVNQDGTPMADEPFRVRGGRAKDGGERTDGEGKLTICVPVTTREVTVEFTERNLCHLVRIGDLDPPTEESGVKQRLAHLGFLSEDEMAEPTGQLAEGLRQFQTAKGLPETGALDDQTRSALMDEHGV